MTSALLADCIGLIGVVGILVTYLLLQLSWLKVEDLSYSLINAGASVLILYSLSFNWNWASVVIEIFWFFISLYGVAKGIQQRKELQKNSQ